MYGPRVIMSILKHINAVPQAATPSASCHRLFLRFLPFCTPPPPLVFISVLSVPFHLWFFFFFCCLYIFFSRIRSHFEHIFFFSKSQSKWKFLRIPWRRKKKTESGGICFQKNQKKSTCNFVELKVLWCGAPPRVCEYAWVCLCVCVCVGASAGMGLCDKAGWEHRAEG